MFWGEPQLLRLHEAVASCSRYSGVKNKTSFLKPCSRTSGLPPGVLYTMGNGPPSLSPTSLGAWGHKSKQC